MKVQLVSDVHVEFDRCGIDHYSLPLVERDLLIVAGDLGEGGNGGEFIRRELQKSDVVYIAGNHEFYNCEYQQVLDVWLAAAEEYNRGEHDFKLHFLHDSVATVKDVRVIGSTMWTDFDGNNPNTKNIAQYGMSDYHVISFGNRKIRPDDVYEIHKQGREFVTKELEAAKGHRSIVVTHHAPSRRSIPVGYRSSDVNGCYVTPMDDLLETMGPDVWCHGHTHKSMDYFVGKTNVLCNPRGYVGFELNNGYDESFVFEV